MSLINVYSFVDKNQIAYIVQALHKLDSISNQIQSILLHDVHIGNTSLSQSLQEEGNSILVPMECDKSQTQSIIRNERVGC